MMASWRAPVLGVLAAFGLAAGVVSVTAGPATATAVAVSCPTVSSSGAVSPAPSPGVDWAGCNLTDAYLPSADMAGALLQNATLTGAYLPDADLASANLSGVTATNNANLAGDNLSDAILTSANLSSTVLSDANLQSANLSSASAVGAKFTAAQMQKANLQDIGLDEADLTSANLFGASLTGATYDSGTTWTNATCPNGASANYYTDGCLSAVAVTTPSATPVVTAGTMGNNGWYISGVTVTWYWIDSNSLVSAQCPSTTSTTEQGAAVVVSASCTDSSGNVGTGSLTVKIDTTPPVVTLNGVTPGGIYLLGQSPDGSCTTTDAISGVADYAVYTALGGRPDGTGVLTATCSNATDQAGNEAPTVSVKYQVVYAFGGFLSPKPGAKLSPSARKIIVTFRLTNAAGQDIPASTAAGLAAVYDVRATLRGPDTKPVVSSCSWTARAKEFHCVITRPRHIRTGSKHKYSLTVTENLGGGFVTVPPNASSENPEPVYFG
jgi:hypothetical protein